MTLSHASRRLVAATLAVVVLGGSAESVTVTSASTTLGPGAQGTVSARVEGVSSCRLAIGGQRRTVRLDATARYDVAFRYRVGRSARPGRYAATLACGTRQRTLRLRVRAASSRGTAKARRGRLLQGPIRVSAQRSPDPAPPADPAAPGPAGTAPPTTEGAGAPATSTTGDGPRGTRVRTWTFDRPFAIPATGPVALVHFWAGCPTCNSEPGYAQLQDWADAHPEVAVIAFSCMRDLHAQWLEKHPSWRREPGFPIYLPGGDVGAFDTCIRRIGSGLRPVYHTNAGLVDGQVQLFTAPWFTDWPLRRR